MTPSPPGLPLEQLTPWLGDHVPQFDATGQVTAALLAGGRSNLTYEVTDGSGRQWAVRRPPLGHIMPSAHDLKREFTVLNGLSRAGYPVPRPWVHCDEEDVIGAQFLVMDFVSGVVISDSDDASRLSPMEADAASRELVDGLAALHSLDAAAIGLAEFGRPQGYLQRQIRRWGQQWELSKTRELGALDAIATWLTDRVDTLPPDTPWSIVHGDFRIDNLILAPQSMTLRAIVDWEMSTLGDPLTDLGLFIVYWQQWGDGGVLSTGGAAGLPGFPGLDVLTARYGAATGRDLSTLDFYVVFAFYKLAIILEGINARFRMGLTLGDGFDRMGEAVTTLLDAALGVADASDLAALRG